VAARAAAFSDPGVASLLAGAFVPVAEDCSVLQRQQDAEGDLFRLIAEQGHYGGRFQPTDTRQGMYACAPDGSLLASCNVHGADRLLPVLRRALAEWEGRPAGRRAGQVGPTAEGAGDPRYLRRPPEGGLILRVWSRDLPRAPQADTRPDDWRRKAFNLDHAWLRAVARRLARCHCIDNVRGEPPAWRPEEVVRSELEFRVLGLREGRLRLEVAGTVSVRGHSRWVDDFSRQPMASDRGAELRFEGEAVWDARARRWVRLDLVAAGPRWGATQYNARNDDPGPAPIGLCFELVGGEGTRPLPGDGTPPHAVFADYFGQA
jgi:hypothetical protein